MNVVETAAFHWLQQRGYPADAIQFQYTRSPDFITADGDGWEVKRVSRRRVVFGARQICDIRRFGPTEVLIWQLGDDKPLAVVPFDELTIPGEWGGFQLRATWQPAHDFPRSLRTPAEVDAVIARYAAQAFQRKALAA